MRNIEIILSSFVKRQTTRNTRICLMACMFFFSLMASAQVKGQTQVLLETNKGNIRITLYDDTPLHRDNFIKLVKSGFYDGLLFHRVINRFMIQGGDSASRHATAGQMLGDSPEGYSIPAEIRFPERFHKRGALAAAREGDHVNPQRVSSMSQFYIVCGQKFNDEILDKIQQRIDQSTNGSIKLTPEIRKVYRETGGTPHLDGQYTVFGEVTEGMDVVESIEKVETDANDRPLEDVRIIRAQIVTPR